MALPEAAVEAFDEGMRAFIAAEDAAAAAAFESALAQAPDFDDGQYMLALAELRLGRPEKAEALLRSVAARTANVMLRDYALAKLQAMGVETEAPPPISLS